ncbi:Phosphatidylinositol N-acetylglucosaminyltransferase subunit Q, partial [Gonioctena quinquepunctata]
IYWYLGFTILLFLLPTTTLYYTVFSVFRLVILCFDEISRRIRYLLNIIPVYVIILWIFNSSSIAGSLHLVWNGFEKNGTMKMEAKLNKLPICCCIKKFLPVNVCDTKHSTLGYLIYNMLTGTII